VFNNHHRHRRANRGLVSSVPAEDITSFHIHQQEEARALYPPPCLGHAAIIHSHGVLTALNLRLRRHSKQRLSKEAGKSMYANIVVEDLAGLGMSHMYTPGIDLFKKIIAMDQNNYPDTLKVRTLATLARASADDPAPTQFRWCA